MKIITFQNIKIFIYRRGTSKGRMLQLAVAPLQCC